MSKRAEKTKEVLRDRFIDEINRLWPQAMGRVMAAENKLTPVEEQAVLQQMAGYAQAYFFGAYRCTTDNLMEELNKKKAERDAKKAKTEAQLKAKKDYKGGVR